MVVVSIVSVLGVALLSWPSSTLGAGSRGCDTDMFGYNCNTPISHHWGQYSAWFSVPSSIKDILPPQCSINFVQILSRHGARYPTSSRTPGYQALIKQIQDNVPASAFTGHYAFLANYKYDLGADDLTAFGKKEMLRSGRKFYTRYEALASSQTPFIRASGEDRVVDSANAFAAGYHSVKKGDPGAGEDPYPYNVLVIPEGAHYNNTLDHSTCKNFERGKYNSIPDNADEEWITKFAAIPRDRINNDLPGANLTLDQIPTLMELCPFNTLVPVNARKESPFCQLFLKLEWEQYNYLQSIDKYYSYGQGNPLGPTQGVGFTNELIARLTGNPVQDATSVNHTLDSDPATFPLGGDQKIFADFSHDTQMTSIFFAMNLFSQTQDLPTNKLQSADAAAGYSSAHTVPFGARAYIEKMTCTDQDEDLVRVLVNDYVVPLQGCNADNLGRCTVSSFINTLSFAQGNGKWDLCGSKKN